LGNKMARIHLSVIALMAACFTASLAGCWVHAEPDHPHRQERREIIVHPEDGDGHHDDDHHHHHHDDHHD
jgi:hypothetical protein